ncbi:pilus assembly protein [Brevibacillus sp. AY1]|uniref:Flp family type IVb pilin n=1 Tax=Brevibacillus sp. AY1 TaxID=2807621 RepID=UPI002454A567|nr:pilus assembly protein [Brevibacillus sp. AY1]MDH4619812.1 pilus assembly protein [Brevibacillus sp. AY1]
MSMITQYLKRFWQDEDGVTIVEMVIIIAVILMAVIPALMALGEAEEARLQEITDKLSK